MHIHYHKSRLFGDELYFQLVNHVDVGILGTRPSWKGAAVAGPFSLKKTGEKKECLEHTFLLII